MTAYVLSWTFALKEFSVIFSTGANIYHSDMLIKSEHSCHFLQLVCVLWVSLAFKIYFRFVLLIFSISVCFNALELHAGYDCTNSTKIGSHFMCLEFLQSLTAALFLEMCSRSRTQQLNELHLQHWRQFSICSFSLLSCFLF